MKIYFSNECLFVAGSKQVFPALSLAYTDNGNRIIVMLANGEHIIAKPRWQAVQDINGNSFDSIEEVRTYLDTEFTRTSGGLAVNTALLSIGGSSPAPYAHYIKTAAQNIGGADGARHIIGWDSNIHQDEAFVHVPLVSTSIITITEAGRYEIKSSLGFQQLINNRVTIGLYYRINGVTEVFRGMGKNYSRGSIYGDGCSNIATEYDFAAGDYIEIMALTDDTDSQAGNVNVFVDQCELIMRKLT